MGAVQCYDDDGDDRDMHDGEDDGSASGDGGSASGEEDDEDEEYARKLERELNGLRVRTRTVGCCCWAACHLTPHHLQALTCVDHVTPHHTQALTCVDHVWCYAP